MVVGKSHGVFGWVYQGWPGRSVPTVPPSSGLSGIGGIGGLEPPGGFGGIEGTPGGIVSPAGAKKKITCIFMLF